MGERHQGPGPVAAPSQQQWRAAGQSDAHTSPTTAKGPTGARSNTSRTGLSDVPSSEMITPYDRRRARSSSADSRAGLRRGRSSSPPVGKNSEGDLAASCCTRPLWLPWGRSSWERFLRGPMRDPGCEMDWPDLACFCFVSPPARGRRHPPCSHRANAASPAPRPAWLGPPCRGRRCRQPSPPRRHQSAPQGGWTAS